MSQNPYDTRSQFDQRPAPKQPGYEAWQEAPGPTRTSALAVSSLILALACVTAPIAVILGVSSLFLIARSRGRLTGKGVALAGVVIGVAACMLWSAVLLGGLALARMYSSKLAVPAGQVVKAIEEQSFDSARALLATRTAANITDEQLAAFGAAVRAEMGAFDRMPDSMGDLFSFAGSATTAMEFSQRTAERMGPVAPVFARFQKGHAVIWVQASQDDMRIENLLVATNARTLVWLIDPAGGTLPGATAPLLSPPPAAPPSAPAPAADDAPPPPPDGPEPEKPAKPEGR
ncbi:MAG: DUF4190 domain-containing protein [Phycisphaerae bacterium]|nr:DUF4190 domain-containing protein [Phycisphaerae bacterium]